MIQRNGVIKRTRAIYKQFRTDLATVSDAQIVWDSCREVRSMMQRKVWNKF